MQELVLCRGIPASGKTTYAKAWVTAAENRARVNRDDIRMSVFGKEFGVNERLVSVIEDGIIKASLTAGSSVIVDDTNIKHEYVKRMAAIAQRLDVPVRIFDFPISVEEALARNAARDRKVPEGVIRDMHRRLEASGPVDLSHEAVQKYEPKPGATKAILVDVDGTLAERGTRSPYDWSKVGLDTIIPAVVDVVTWASNNGFTVIVMSGRDGVCRPETQDWLDRHNIWNDALYMRSEGDMRKDSIVKRELFDKYVRDNFDVHFVLDDRQQVVDMWRELGLRVFQVDTGDF